MKTLLAVIIFATTSVGAWELGDVDHDSAITCTDVQLVLDFVAQGDSTKLDVSLADMSKNGEVTAYDAALLKEIIGPAPTSISGLRSVPFAEVKMKART